MGKSKMVYGTLSLVDTNGVKIVYERFRGYGELKRRMKAMHVRHWNKLEPDKNGKSEWFLSVIFDDNIFL